MKWENLLYSVNKPCGKSITHVLLQENRNMERLQITQDHTGIQ